MDVKKQIVFDFDWSLINADSDDVVVGTHLPNGLDFLGKRSAELGWLGGAVGDALKHMKASGTTTDREQNDGENISTYIIVCRNYRHVGQHSVHA